MGTSLAGAPALDAYLHDSFSLIQYVADNMDAIKAVADHLTPVEDLVDFKATIDALYAQLGLLVEASQLIIQATPAGIAMLLAADAPAQRLLLGLGTAALQDEGYFAKTTDLDTLSAYVDQIKVIVDQLTLDMAGLVTQDQLTAATAGLQTQLDGLASSTTLNDRINSILVKLAAGEYTDTLNSQVTALTTRVTDTEGNLIAQASLVNTLSTRVTVSEQGISASASDVMALRVDVNDAQAQLAGSATAISSLSTRTFTLEGKVTSQASDVTVLSARADNLDGQVSSQADALQSLTVLASNTDGEQKTTAASVTALFGRMVDAETGVAANVAATQTLSTEMAATQAGLAIAASSVTDLKASITGTGNLLTNAGFDLDTRAWSLFSKGAGWLASELQRNLDPTLLPPALSVLSLTADGVPSGKAGIQSARITITPQTRYILSGYLASENCTFEMDWRLYDQQGTPIGFGVVGSVTNVAPSQNLASWQQVYTSLTTSFDAAQLEVQLWVSACNTGSPKVWLLHPQLEEAIGNQTTPAAWAPGINALSDTMASVVDSLQVRVTSNEEGLLAATDTLTSLQSSLGNIVTWRVVTLSGSGNAASVGAPLEPSIRVDGAATAAYSLLRGLTLIQFTTNGTIGATTNYDTYASASARTALATALDALGPSDGFLLVSEDNHGIADAGLTTAIERCGAHDFASVAGATPYALRGRGGIGKGNGVEVLPTGADLFIDFTFVTSNSMPQDVGGPSTLAAVSDAIQGLSTKVTEIDGTVSANSLATTDLTSRIDGAEGALVNEMIIRADRDAVITSQMNAMDSRLASAESDVTAAASTVAGYETRLTAAEGSISSQTTDISSLQNSVTNLQTGQSANNTTIATLTSDVSINKDNITVQGSSITSLDSRLTTAEGNVTTNASAISGLTTRVTSAEGTITSQSSDITSLQSSLATANNSISANGTAISGLDTRVSTAEGNITSQSSSITSLQSSVSAKTTTFVQATAPTALRTGDLWVESDNNNKLWTWSGTAWLDASANGITVFAQTTAPTAKNVGDLWFDTDDNNRQYRWDGSAWVDMSDARLVANASAINSLTTRVTTAEGNISSQATSITSLQSSVSSNTSAISNESTTRANADSANANNISSLTTTVNGNTSTISSQQTSINGVLAKAGVTLDVNNYITGWSVNNNGSSGAFNIRADMFSIVAPGTGARTEFSNGNWRVYDTAGVLRVRMGVW